MREVEKGRGRGEMGEVEKGRGSGENEEGWRREGGRG